jgi:quinol monooxygenase YgiN
MQRAYRFLMTAALLPSLATAQSSSSTPPDTVLTAVAYVEARAPAAAAARTALERYRDASRGQDGFIRVEFFEQVGRAGHFAVLEAWRDQAAFDVRDPGPQKGLLDALEPTRVSGYDERPYKILAAAPEIAAADTQAVYVITHVDVAPNPAVAPLLARLAETSRQEAGNLRFDVLQHTMRANHFTVIEHWRSRAALEAHVAAAHTRRYRDELQPLTGSPLDERLYVAVGASGD